MSDTAPTIDSTGIHVKSYAEILSWLQGKFREIYGPDIYIENDSQDGQFVALLASAINDSNAAAVAVYNSFSPTTSQGNGLSRLVKINGITRTVPTYSTVDVDIEGVVGTTISNGVVEDVNGNKWNLPTSVLIPISGEITVTATAQDAGAINAAIGDVNKILTPTLGWQTVTNPTASVPGEAVETDAELRIRQSRSTATPSQSIFEGIEGAIANLSGVTRYKLYENDTDTTDSDGIPAHSICLVVEGGDVDQIASAITLRKTVGTGTYGDVVVTSDVNTIRFFRPIDVSIKVEITIAALTGYSSAIGDQIKAAIVSYINGIGISEDVYYTRLFVPANLGNVNGITYNITNMEIAKVADPFGTSDIVIDFNEVANCVVGDVTITVV